MPSSRELPNGKPDEIWIIQIDPQERNGVPESMADILDRRNELAGNLSLYQEIHFIEKINELVDDLGEGERFEDKRFRWRERNKEYRPIKLRRIEMSRELDFASKLDRSPSFICEMMRYGEVRAEELFASIAFEKAWRAGNIDAILNFFTQDAVVDIGGSLQGDALYEGKDRIQNFVQEHLTTKIRVDPTKRQVAGDRVSWRVKVFPDRSAGGGAGKVKGTVEAAFYEGKIEYLTFVPNEEASS